MEGAPDPTPDALAAAHDNVLRSENTFTVDTTGLKSVRARAERGWGVGALAVHDGEALFVRHDDQWLLPGGMLEAGETPAEGAARETREETGVEVRIDGLGRSPNRRSPTATTRSSSSSRCSTRPPRLPS